LCAYCLFSPRKGAPRSLLSRAIVAFLPTQERERASSSPGTSSTRTHTLRPAHPPAAMTSRPVTPHAVKGPQTPTSLIEKWLENTLSFSLHKLSHSNASAMEQMKIDRAQLVQQGLTKQEQDRIYRSFFVYTNGIHEIMESVDPTLSMTLWDVFMRLLENCDPNHSELYSIFLQQKHDEKLAEAVKAQKTELDKAMEMCAQLSKATAQSELKCMSLENKVKRDKIYYESMFAVTQNKVTSLQQQLATEKAVREALEGAVADGTQSTTVCGRKIGELSGIKTAQAKVLAENKTQISELQREVTHLKRTLASAETKLKTVAESDNVAKLKIREQQGEAVELRAEIGRHHNEIERLNGVVLDKEAMLQQFQAMCLELNKTVGLAVSELEDYYLRCADDTRKQHMLSELIQTQELARLNEAFVKDRSKELEAERAAKASTITESPTLEGSERLTDRTIKRSVVLGKLERNIQRAKGYITSLHDQFFNEFEQCRFVSEYEGFVAFIEKALCNALLLEFRTYKLMTTEQQLVAAGFVGNVYQQTSSRLHEKLANADGRHKQSVEQFNQVVDEQRQRLLEDMQRQLQEADKKYAALNVKYKEVQIEILRLEASHSSSMIKVAEQQKNISELVNSRMNKHSETAQLQSALQDKNTYVETLVEQLKEAHMKEHEFKGSLDSLRAVLFPVQGVVLASGTQVRAALDVVKEGKHFTPGPSAASQLPRMLAQITSGEMMLASEWTYVVSILLESIIGLKESVDELLPMLNDSIALRDEVKGCRTDVLNMKNFCNKEKRRISKFYDEQIIEKGLAETFNFYEKLEGAYGASTKTGSAYSTKTGASNRYGSPSAKTR
jgi:predicted  nucleic acid-binding Zn-ribbon protein